MSLEDVIRARANLADKLELTAVALQEQIDRTNQQLQEASRRKRLRFLSLNHLSVRHLAPPWRRP